MRRFWIIPLVVVALVIPVAVLAGGGGGGFNGVVSSIESRYHVHAMRIPFMGVVSGIARIATKDGVGNMHVAEFENFSAQVDGEELNRMVEEKLGSGWERMVRETSRKGKEQTLVFVHPEGERMGMFVVDLDGKEMNVVQISVDPNRLNDSIVKYEHHQSHGDGPDSN